MTICIGITQRDVQCKHIVKNGSYCFQHLSQFNEFYQGGHDQWPTMAQIHKRMKVSSRNVKNYDKELLCSDISYYLKAYGHRHDIYLKRMCLLMTMESMLICRSLVLGCGDWQKLVNAMVEKCNEEKSGMLVKYSENFRCKVDRDYRLAAQQRCYLPLLFSKTILCSDCIMHIVSFI